MSGSAKCARRSLGGDLIGARHVSSAALAQSQRGSVAACSRVDGGCVCHSEVAGCRLQVEM